MSQLIQAYFFLSLIIVWVFVFSVHIVWNLAPLSNLNILVVVASFLNYFYEMRFLERIKKANVKFLYVAVKQFTDSKILSLKFNSFIFLTLTSNLASDNNALSNSSNVDVKKNLYRLTPETALNKDGVFESKYVFETDFIPGLPDIVKSLMSKPAQFEEFSNIVNDFSYINLNSFLALFVGIQIFIFGIIGVAFNKNNFISLFLSMETTLLGVTVIVINIAIIRMALSFLSLPLIILAIAAAESVVVLSLVIFIYKSGWKMGGFSSDVAQPAHLKFFKNKK